MQVDPEMKPPSEAAPACILMADDLTGACDSGVVFAQQGLTTRVGLGQAPTRSAAVLGISTDSRRLAGPASATLTRKIADGLPLRSATILFRKIDSTLRGNIVAECDALLDAAQAPFGVIAPALPSQGRIVTEGILRVRDLAREWTMNIAGCLAELGATVVRVDPRSSGGVEEMAALMTSLATKTRYMLCDAANDEDLASIAQALLACSDRPLWIGSAGLARQAARLLRPRDKSAQHFRPDCIQAPVVFCVGSNHPVTDLQLREIARRYMPVVLDAATTTDREVQRVLNRGSHLILRIDTGKPDRDHLQELLRTMGRNAPAALVMTGGDTAALVCYAAKVQQLLLEGELVDGVATGRLEGGFLDGLRFATKSGGFGSEACLTDTLHSLSSQPAGERR